MGRRSGPRPFSSKAGVIVTSTEPGRGSFLIDPEILVKLVIALAVIAVYWKYYYRP